MNPPSLSIVVLGATGAVGGYAARALAATPAVAKLSLLGRRAVEGVAGSAVAQHVVDVFAPASYAPLLPGHDIAVCTLGIGEPSKSSKAELVRVDRDAVLDFARACKDAGVRHFELLSAVGANSASASFYLRTKGELEDGLKALNFQRLSLFQPSAILTPTNRYGVSQGLLLAAMPLLKPLLQGGLKKYRGIDVQQLGLAMARNVLAAKSGVETLHWAEITALAALAAPTV